MSTTPVVRSLYRRALKLALDWTVYRNLWRGQALYLRALFDAKKDVRDPRLTRGLHAQDLIEEAEYLLDQWKHPDPYRPPGAPGGLLRSCLYGLVAHGIRADQMGACVLTGTKYERNIPAPQLEPPPRWLKP
ncbi:MAG: hypothetical protein M1826_006366 [Phylliscum demangeonii]|nr:MAG: hypothetical protein M1826_006366 [Phylliscum demangeonii]